MTAFDKAWGLIRKKSWDGLDDDEGWDDSDPFACRGCGYEQTPAEWQMKACKECGTRNTLHPMYRSGGADDRCNICGDDPSPRSSVCEECILESPLYSEIDNQTDEGMMVNVETGDVQHPDMGHALYNLYDYYDQDTGEKIEKSEFDKAWGVAKFEDEDSGDLHCDKCDSVIENGKQYSCDRCEHDVCPDCMLDNKHGYMGYRGTIDDDVHPAYADNPMVAWCPKCGTEAIAEWEEEEKERMEEEAEEEALRQLEEVSIRNDQKELDRKLSEQPFFGDNRGKMLGQDESPHFHSKFHPDWQDKMKSKDSFESAWDIAKEAPIDECKGCGLAHGTPNSKYCSEICERQNKVAKAADWDTGFDFKEYRKKATWSQEDIDRLNAHNDKIRQEMKDNPPVPSDADHMAAHNSWRATGPKRDVLADALSRARRENAKPKPKLRITRPEDWE